MDSNRPDGETEEGLVGQREPVSGGVCVSLCVGVESQAQAECGVTERTEGRRAKCTLWAWSRGRDARRGDMGREGLFGLVPEELGRAVSSSLGLAVSGGLHGRGVGLDRDSKTGFMINGAAQWERMSGDGGGLGDAESCRIRIWSTWVLGEGGGLGEGLGGLRGEERSTRRGDTGGACTKCDAQPWDVGGLWVVSESAIGCERYLAFVVCEGLRLVETFLDIQRGPWRAGVSVPAVCLCVLSEDVDVGTGTEWSGVTASDMSREGIRDCASICVSRGVGHTTACVCVCACGV